MVHCSPEGHHHHQRYQPDWDIVGLLAHPQDEHTSAAEGLTRWHLAVRFLPAKWRRLRPHSHWQTSHVMYCTKLELPRATATNHCGGHGQSHGMLCSMLCHLAVRPSCSKPNLPQHTPYAEGPHCASGLWPPCCLCLSAQRLSVRSSLHCAPCDTPHLDLSLLQSHPSQRSLTCL